MYRRDLLFNICLNDLFLFSENIDTCNFADDTKFHDCNKDLNSFINRLELDSLFAIEWFGNNNMKLNQNKCHLIVSRLIWKWICLCWFVNNLGDWKLLSIIIDRKLNFNDYVTSVWRYVGKKLSVLARLSYCIWVLKKRRILLKNFIKTQFSFCSLVWMTHSATLNHKINHLNERALRIVYMIYDCS